MISLPTENIFSSQTNLVLPPNLWRLTQAISMKRFDPMIGYGYAMAITSALAQRYCRVKIADSFETELSLFFLMIAPSGSGKGSLWRSIYLPLTDLIRRQRYQNSEENKRRAAEIASLQNIIAEKRKQAKRLSGFALAQLMQEITDLEMQKPILIPEYVFDIQDVTSASLLEELDRQESHSVLIADTEGRFMRSLDEDKALAGLLNQAFVGESINNRRTSVKSCRVENPRVALVTAIQPDKLKRLTRNPALWGEGMIPRTLPYYSPYGVQPQAAIGENVDNGIMEWWRKKVEYLFNLSPCKDNIGNAIPYVLELAPDAKMRFENYAVTLQKQRCQPVNAGLEGTFARMAELTARVSAIYHILEQPAPFDTAITGTEMELAVGICSYFLENHIRRLYMEFHPVVLPMMKLMPQLCDWLRAREGTQAYVTLKDMFNGIGKVKTGLRDAVTTLVHNNALIPANLVEFQNGYWWRVKSSGFNINFPALSLLPW